MTVGNVSIPWHTPGYSSNTTAYYSDVGPNGPWTALGTSLHGIYHVKSWSGVDRPVNRFRHPYTHTYFYWDINGKRRVRRTFHYGGTYEPAKKEWHPYSMSSRDAFYPLFSTAAKRRPYLAWEKDISFLSWYQETSSLHLPVPPVWGSNDEINLIGKLRERVMGSDFNPSIFFAEGVEAVDMISHSASRIAAGLISLKRSVAKIPSSIIGGGGPQLISSTRKALSDCLGYLTGARNADQILKGIKVDKNLAPVPLRGTPREKVVSSLWLEAQFGWIPLLSDIKKAAEFTALQFQERPARKQWTVYKKNSVSKQDLDAFNTDFYFQQAECFVLRKIVYRATEDPANSVAYSGIADPELVAWELLPYSFLVDYLLPVGNYLEARAFATRLKGEFLLTTLSVLSESNPVAKPPVYASFGPSFARKVSMVRTTSTTLNVPLPALKSAEKIASFTRLGNVFALLGVASSGRGLPRR